MAATSIACVILVTNMALDAKKVPTVIHGEVDLVSFAAAFGTICFAFGGHPTFPTFQADMREPAKFGKACLIAYLGTIPSSALASHTHVLTNAHTL